MKLGYTYNYKVYDRQQRTPSRFNISYLHARSQGNWYAMEMMPQSNPLADIQVGRTIEQ